LSGCAIAHVHNHGVSIEQESGGFKHFSSNRVLRSPADFAGLKMRVLGPLAVPLIEALKASAVPIEFGDLYTALTTGLVDVQDNSLSIFRLIRLQGHPKRVQARRVMAGRRGRS
jgi:TRAP-type C4-dicarboxylate transport system substrate-binding protein